MNRPKQTKTNPRRLALDILNAVIDRGESLSAVAPRLLPRISDARDRAFAYRLVLNSLRYLNRYAWMRDQLLERPFKGKDMDVANLLLLGISQLSDPNMPVHASLNETVEIAKSLKKNWAVNLVNAVLRNFQRQQSELIAKADQDPTLVYSHPKWLVNQLQTAWPEDRQTILQANNIPASLCLRLRPHINRDIYLASLDPELNAQAHPDLPQAILLNTTDVVMLPLFNEGAFSVQDAHAQWAAHILKPQQNEAILDACAAPGGKTTHLLDLANNQLDLLALDIEDDRLDRIQDNLERLSLSAQLQAADAADLDSWWDGKLFDAILLDAPCSATGIIRRHPDIKWHRKPQDIQPLTEQQKQLLDHLWQTLKPNGRMIYATCSVLAAENSDQIQAFLKRTPDAKLEPIDLPHAIDTGAGHQLLPKNNLSGDGFFYALIRKQATTTI